MPTVRISMQANNDTKIVGFNEQIESLPPFFDEFNSQKKLRQMFLSLSSKLVDDIYSFTKYEQKTFSSYSLKTIFEYKIKSMLPLSNLKPFKPKCYFKLDIASTNIINNYVLKQNRVYLYSYKKLLPAAKLISLCFVNNKLQLNFDMDLLFHQFVLKKIEKLHTNKYVVDNGDSISIIGLNQTPLKIYTQWKQINTKKLNIQHELKNAIECIKQSEFKQVYLVYPKDIGFKRHIPIEVQELEHKHYDIKVIPYSLRSTIK